MPLLTPHDTMTQPPPFTIHCCCFFTSLSPPIFSTRGSTFATSTMHTIPLHPPTDPNKHAGPRSIVPDYDVAPPSILAKEGDSARRTGNAARCRVGPRHRSRSRWDRRIDLCRRDRNPRQQQQRVLEQGRGGLARTRRRTTTDRRHHRHATTKEGGGMSARGHRAPYPLHPPLLGWGRY